MSKENLPEDASLSKERRREIKNEYRARQRKIDEKHENLLKEKYGVNQNHTVPPTANPPTVNPGLLIAGAVIAVIAIMYFADATAGTWIIVVVGSLIGLVIWVYASASPEERAGMSGRVQDTLSQNLICPHCQTRGSVSTTHVRRKKGISGGKAMGAFFTGGFSMLVTGLARKEDTTQAHCSNCGSTWDF